MDSGASSNDTGNIHRPSPPEESRHTVPGAFGRFEKNSGGGDARRLS